MAGTGEHTGIGFLVGIMLGGIIPAELFVGLSDRAVPFVASNAWGGVSIMVAFNRKIAGSDVPVVSGSIRSKHSGGHHSKTKTRRHFRAEEGQSLLGPKPDLAHMTEVLREERDNWQKARDNRGHSKKGSYIVSSAKSSTLEILLSAGVNVGKQSEKDERESLVRTVSTEARGYREPDHFKKARKLEPGITAGGKRARAPLRVNPAEEQYVFADGTVPVGTKEKKKPVGLDSALAKEDTAIKVSIMRKRGYVVPTIVNIAILKKMAIYFVKVDGRYTLLPIASTKCPYTAGHYVAAWQELCSRLSS